MKETKDPVKLVRSGIFALNRKKWKKAVRKFEDALTDETIQQNAIVWANYGIALTNLKRYADAQNAFAIAVQIDGKKGDLWLKKGLVEFQLEQFQEAEKSFKQASQLDKDNDEIPILQSRSIRKRGEKKKGIKILESARKKNPRSSKIPIELSKVWEEEGEYEKSLNVLKNAIKEANQPNPGLLLGQLLLDRQKFGRAIEIYTQILTRFPESYHAQYGIGVAFHAKNDFKRALDAYQKVIPMYHSNRPPQNLFVNIARVFKALDRKKEAIDALYRAKKLGKSSVDIALLLTELFLEINRPDRAKRALEDAVKMDKRNPMLRFYLGMTHLQMDNPEEAKRCFLRSLEFDPSFQESKIQLALLYVREKNIKQAYLLVNEVTKVDPEHLLAKRLAAQLAFDLRDFRRTIELLKPLIEMDPSQIRELELLLNAWLVLSQPEKAHKFMKQLLSENKQLYNQLKSIPFFDQFLEK